MTPSRAFLTIGVLVLTTGGSPFGPGRQARTPQAQDATGFGEPFSSTRHMRQLPAIDSRSWKQKRGISAPAASHAWSSVYSGGTSISLSSTISLVIRRALVSNFAFRACRRSLSCRVPGLRAVDALPQLRRRKLRPAEGVIARPALAQVVESLDPLAQRRPMAFRNPPHHELGALFD